MDTQYVVSKGTSIITKGDWVAVTYGGVLLVGRNSSTRPETVLASDQWDVVGTEKKE